jgi:hypothetical protein
VVSFLLFTMSGCFGYLWNGLDANIFFLTYRLERVEANGNWLFPLDQITPIEIYV